jgi:hypothetical protein
MKVEIIHVDDWWHVLINGKLECKTRSNEDAWRLADKYEQDSIRMDEKHARIGASYAK